MLFFTLESAFIVCLFCLSICTGFAFRVHEHSCLCTFNT
ncbi:hypothetical protein SXCC_02971 [Gluconacetobacter sp. SXCC-1]|nr:hypothetical protein SXCC_02971 [Gluconacetobacter sp. SXCC-1]